MFKKLHSIFILLIISISVIDIEASIFKKNDDPNEILIQAITNELKSLNNTFNEFKKFKSLIFSSINDQNLYNKNIDPILPLILYHPLLEMEIHSNTIIEMNNLMKEGFSDYKSSKLANDKFQIQGENKMILALKLSNVIPYMLATFKATIILTSQYVKEAKKPMINQGEFEKEIQKLLSLFTREKSLFKNSGNYFAESNLHEKLKMISEKAQSPKVQKIFQKYNENYARWIDFMALCQDYIDALFKNDTNHIIQIAEEYKKELNPERKRPEEKDENNDEEEYEEEEEYDEDEEDIPDENDE